MLTNHDSEELRIRCDALRGLLYAECGFELDEIAAVENAALSEFRANGDGQKLPSVSLPPVSMPHFG